MHYECKNRYLQVELLADDGIYFVRRRQVVMNLFTNIESITYRGFKHFFGDENPLFLLYYLQFSRTPFNNCIKAPCGYLIFSKLNSNHTINLYNKQLES